MAGSFSHPKTPSHSLYVFSLNSPSYFSSPSSSSSSTLISMKLKGTLVHTRIARSLSRAKSIIIQILKDLQLIQFIVPLKNNKKKKNKLYFGSFRLHYNWCSSHVLPVSITDHVYYDSTWNSVIRAENDDMAESRLSGYLQWLEENNKACGNSGASDHTNDIDRLADMFIANCHEKFRLEKQESNRRFQEMMARSV